MGFFYALIKLTEPSFWDKGVDNREDMGLDSV